MVNSHVSFTMSNMHSMAMRGEELVSLLGVGAHRARQWEGLIS